jgi:hypothetical protein
LEGESHPFLSSFLLAIVSGPLRLSFSRIPKPRTKVNRSEAMTLECYCNEEIGNFSNRGVLLLVIRSDPVKLPVTFLTTTQNAL